MELLLIIMSRSSGFNSKRISECDDEEEEEDGVDEDKSNKPKPLQMAANFEQHWQNQIQFKTGERGNE